MPRLVHIHPDNYNFIIFNVVCLFRIHCQQIRYIIWIFIIGNPLINISILYINEADFISCTIEVNLTYNFCTKIIDVRLILLNNCLERFNFLMSRSVSFERYSLLATIPAKARTMQIINIQKLSCAIKYHAPITAIMTAHRERIIIVAIMSIPFF